MDTGYTLQAVWPIVDVRPLRDLIAEATDDLARIARQAHCETFGVPVWRVYPAHRVPGFDSHAPGQLLVCFAAARPVARPVQPLRAAA